MAPRRDKEAQRDWLTEKRQAPIEGLDRNAPAGEPSCTASSCDSSRKASDFRAFYEAQQLFGVASPKSAEEFETFWSVLRSPLPVTVRVCPQRCPLLAARTESRLAATGWERRREFDRAGMSVWQIEDERYTGTTGVREWTELQNRWGSLAFQEVVSLLPAMILAPSPEHICLDLCAAPGNKSLQLVEALDRNTAVGESCRTGAVLSGEYDGKRCCLVLQRMLSKADSPAAGAVLANAKDFPLLIDSADHSKRLPYSRILADVPCSGDGTTRKNVQLWHSWKRREALKLHTLQRNILFRALHLLPPGGVMVYSTCSLNPIENEAVILCALRRCNTYESIELLDTCAACQDVCDLHPSPGLTKWLVPAPGRGGALFTDFSEVPQEFHVGAGGLIKPDMFPHAAAGDKELTAKLCCCARFYPHHGNTGGFFMAMLRKGASATAMSIPPPMSSTGQFRSHPLLVSQFKRVDANDAAWIELSAFFDVDRAWSDEKIGRGLLFWKSFNGKEATCLTLASEGMARLWNAPVSTGKPLSWVRLGKAIFEHLPKGFLTGKIAPTRWRAAPEGTKTVAQVTRRRRLSLPPATMLGLLRSENRQVSISNLAGAVLDGHALCGESHHECGGVLVSVEGSGFQCLYTPGALTPRLLRLLVDKDAAEALEDLLTEQLKPNGSSSLRHTAGIPDVLPCPAEISHHGHCPSWACLAAVARSICQPGDSKTNGQ